MEEEISAPRTSASSPCADSGSAGLRRWPSSLRSTRTFVPPVSFVCLAKLHLVQQPFQRHSLFRDEITALKERLGEAGENTEKVKEELLNERRSWVQQIEDNRQRHLEEMHSLKRQQQEQVDDLGREHQNAIDAIVFNLKEQHR